MEHINSSNHCVTCQRALRRQRQVHVLNRDNLEGRFGEYVLQRINLQEVSTIKKKTFIRISVLYYYLLILYSSLYYYACTIRIILTLLFQIPDNNQQLMCHRCWMAAGRAGQQEQVSGENNPRPIAAEEEVNVEEDPSAVAAQMLMPIADYRRAANTARHCIFPDCDRSSLRRIPGVIKRFMLMKHNYYIPPNARICQPHLEVHEWEELLEVQPGEHNFSSAHITDMLNTMKASATSPQIDFNEVESIEAGVLHFWAGLNHDQFNRLVEETPSLVNYRQPKQILGLYLCKIRTGESNQRLASLFQIDRHTVERKLIIARRCLANDFVPLHLGYNHITREEIIRRNLSIPNGIYGDGNQNKAIVVMDGTYVYIQKSGNFLFQKDSYSLHKFRNLLKPFLIVCSDGYIIDVTGPHAASTSDAAILKNMVNDEECPLHWLLHQNDVIVLDRGFRDAIPDLEEHGYIVHYPPTKNRHQNQLTTEQANQSRLVTIVRWVVEVVNGWFKRDYKIFRHEYFNRALPHMFVDFRIAAALLNTFRAPIQDNPRNEEILNIIRQRLNIGNKLADYVEQSNLNRRRAAFVQMNADTLSHFPRMTEEDIYFLSLGSYQIKLARSYCKEHMRQNGLYSIEIFQQPCTNELHRFNISFEPGSYILRGRIKSRHVSRCMYYSYIIVNSQSIGEYYCSCLTGQRTVGTCAHIISLVWYLGYARHEGIAGPADFLDDIIIDDFV